MEIKFDFKKRRDCRVFAFQYICASLILQEEIDVFLKNLFEISEFYYAGSYAETLLENSLKNKEELIILINKYTKENWSFDRLDSQDKAILLLAAYEIKHQDVPNKVAINEALELSKIFSYGDSKKYINAILDKIANS